MIEQKLQSEGYILLTELKSDSFDRIHGKIQNKKGEKFFVKAVSVKNKYAYKSLINEIEITRYLFSKTKAKSIKNKNYQLVIPRIEKTFKTKDYVCLISEYVEGKSLLESNSEEQAKVLIEIIELLSELTKSTNYKKIKRYMKNYKISDLIIDMPIKTAKALFLQPLYFSQIINTFFNGLKLLRYTNDNSSELIHADLNSSNIIINKNKIYLFDWEEAGWGIKYYNIAAPLSVHWTNKTLKNNLISYYKNKKDVIHALLAYRVLLMLNQKLDIIDSRRIRDIKLLNYISGGEKR